MPLRRGPFRTACATVFAATILAGCTKELTGPRIATLLIVSGGGQSGVIGTNLTQPLRVQVIDQNGDPAAGVLVSWRVTAGGGSVSPPQSSTDSEGIASATLRLGTALGTNTVVASLTENVSVTFSATALAAPPTRVVAASGNNQTGVVSTQLTQDVVVRVTDDLNNPKAGVTVTFSVATGGGSLSQTAAQTDASGTASVKWTLGPQAGIQTILATVGGLAPLTLSATAQAEATASVVVFSGNNQNGLPGQTLATPLTARVLDRFGNPVAGAVVVFTPAPGSGSVSPASAVTGANGTASTTWQLGGVPGPATVTASSGGHSATFSGGINATYASVSAGGRSSCGITVDNVMVCWGYNGEGQLGIGQPADGSGSTFSRLQPVAAAGNLTFRQTVLNLYHGCGITLGSVAYCWGVNLDGRLGDGTVVAKNAPTQLATAVSFRMIAVSRNHTCGLSLSDRVFCWGYAGDGQTGTGAPPPAPAQFLPVPNEVGGDPTLRFQQVTAGGQHACALTTAGMGQSIYCWGFNASGQLGDGSVTTRLTPALVPAGFTWRNVAAPAAGQAVPSTVSAGYDHTCAVRSNGTVYCWGSNAKGQLGVVGGSSVTPVLADLPGLEFVAVSSGEAHSCALTSAGAIYCWGSNDSGQRGGSSLTTPLSGGPWAGVSAGDQHTCAVTTTNLVFCWGDNQFGQLGDGTQVRRLVPTRVMFQP